MSDPILPFIKTGDRSPYLAGVRCGGCGHVFVGEREICAQCAARGQMAPVRLAETGRLYNFTVVHRSFPGVATPFIDAIVDLDDGAHLKGTLVDIEPAAVRFDMPVRVVFREATPAGADRPYLTFFFLPQEGAAS